MCKIPLFIRTLVVMNYSHLNDFILMNYLYKEPISKKDQYEVLRIRISTNLLLLLLGVGGRAGTQSLSEKFFPTHLFCTSGPQNYARKMILLFYKPRSLWLLVIAVLRNLCTSFPFSSWTHQVFFHFRGFAWVLLSPTMFSLKIFARLAFKQVLTQTFLPKKTSPYDSI